MFRNKTLIKTQIIVIITMSFFLGIGVNNAFTQSGNSIIDNWNSVNEGMEESVTSYLDKQIYLCMQLEELGGFEQDEEDLNEKELKQNADCKELLENTDFFKKKELIQKYGELDG